MTEIINLILHNLTIVGLCLSTLVIFYISNILFSLWYNLQELNHNFDKSKLILSGIKILMFIFALGLLSIGITITPVIFQYAGLEISKEVQELATQSAITVVIMSVAIKYLVEAINKLKKILNAKFEKGEVK